MDPVDGKWKLWYNMFATCSPMSAPICQAGLHDDGTRPKRPGIGGPVPCNGTNQLTAPMPNRTGALCYAESVDGVTWAKPGLGLVGFTDNVGRQYAAAETNIVLGTGLGYPGAAPGGHYPTGSGVTLDEREGEARYKILGTEDGWGSGYVATSEDGLTWANKTTMPAGRWDSHLNVQREPDSGKWVAFTRTKPTPQKCSRIQAVSETKTADFLGEWNTVLPTGLNASEWYQPDALVSFEYEGIYLGFSNVISFNTTLPEQLQQTGGNPGGTVTSELVFSTDAKHWQYLKPGHSFIPRGIPGKDFDCCGIFTAKQGYQLSQQPDTNNTMRVYYGGCNGPFLGSRACALGLARVQKHGWAGMRAHTAAAGHLTAAPVHVPADPVPPYNPKICAPLAGTNCEGSDIRGVGAVRSFHECCKRCADLSGCSAWSWNKGYSPQSCWLKSSCAGRANDTNVVSGVVDIAPSNRTVLLTIDSPVTAKDGVRVGVVGDPFRTVDNCVPLKGKLTEAPIYWEQGANRVGLGQYVGGAVQMEFVIPSGGTLFAFSV